MKSSLVNLNKEGLAPEVGRESVEFLVDYYNTSNDRKVLEVLSDIYYKKNQGEYKKKFSKNYNCFLSHGVKIGFDANDNMGKIIFKNEREIIYIMHNDICRERLSERRFDVASPQAIILKNELCFNNLMVFKKGIKDFTLNENYFSLQYPLYLFYDEIFVKLLMQIYDLSGLINSEQIEWLIGEYNFLDYFKNIQSIIPLVQFGLTELESEELRKINECRMEQKRLAVAEYKKYYRKYNDQIKVNVREGKAKILFIADEATVAEKNSTINSIRACNKLGCETCLVMEESRFKRKDVDIYLKINEFKPDMIFYVNKFRFNLEDMPKEVFFMTWIQDVVLDARDESTPLKLLERDYILYHHITAKWFHEIGYPKGRSIKANIPSNKEIYKKYKLTNDEYKKYTCDICVVAVWSNIAEVIKPLYRNFENKMFFKIILEIAYQFQGEICSGKLFYDEREVKQYVKDKMEKYGIKLYEEEAYDDLAFLFRNWVQQAAYRVAITDWLIEAGYTNLKLYGNGWGEQEKYKKYAMGFAESGETLSKIYQSSKIVLGNNMFTSAAARVWESIFSETFYLANYIPKEYDEVDIREVLIEDEEFVMFYNKGDLLEKIDYYLKNEKERKKIIEAGYNKAMQIMTFDALINRMFEKVKSNLWLHS